MYIRYFRDGSPPDRRPHGLKLAESILKSPTELLLAPIRDHERLSELRRTVLDRLDLPPPANLPSKFCDMESYANSVASLVVEETMYSILSELERRYDFQQEKTFRKYGVGVEVTGEENRCFQCYTHKPLSHINRKEFKAGSVIFMLPAGSERTPESIIFGVVLYGSTVSVPRKFISFYRRIVSLFS